jgi:hypothetical protein
MNAFKEQFWENSFNKTVWGVMFLNIKHVQKLVILNSERSGYISVLGPLLLSFDFCDK